MTDQKIITGIKLGIESEDTGVPANFHVITGLSIDTNSELAYATVSSYYNEKQYSIGKSSVGVMSITIYAKLQRGMDTLNWAYKALVAPVEEGAVDAYGNTITPHALTGGTLVERPIDNQ